MELASAWEFCKPGRALTAHSAVVMVATVVVVMVVVDLAEVVIATEAVAEDCDRSALRLARSDPALPEDFAERSCFTCRHHES